MIDFMKLFAELREAVRKDGRSHAAIAREADIHVKTFSAFINGHRGLSVETVENLAKALGFNIKLVRAK